ncbi:MAG TPA: ArsR family transcriptional regulator [Caldithrix sp.]|nr:ArsR family transcriptional regulator [Caldithrix sp.]
MMPRGMKMGMGGRIMGPMMDPRSRFFMALASDQRLKILELLKEGEKSSREIIDAIGLDPSVISRHLMMMRNAGLVSARKEGVALYFSLADERVLQIIEIATQITRDWFNRFQQFL